MLDTTRRVATPEGIELTLRLAGPVPRALAWAVDLADPRRASCSLVMMVAAQLGRAGWGVVLHHRVLRRMAAAGLARGRLGRPDAGQARCSASRC